jgi:hypothetical protein
LTKYFVSTQIEDEPTRGNNILDLAFVSDPSFVEDFKLGKRHGQPWTRYKSVTKAKKNSRKKWVKFKRSGLFADELLYDQERCVTNYIMSQPKSDFEDKLVNQVKDNPKRFWNYTFLPY